MVVVLKGTLVFCFGPILKLRFWPRPKLNNFVHSCISQTKINNASIFLILYIFRRLSLELILNIKLAHDIHAQGQNRSV